MPSVNATPSVDSWKVIEPDNYYKSCLDKNRRPDGRAWSVCRPLSVVAGTSSGTTAGSATASLGGTTVMCGVMVCRNSGRNFFLN